ncbi:MAG: hypothetical protein U1E69_05105 [Tabrizicola sp.]|uniref:hypothetical protein n=1 Tax=Tabrizicola sp. TaxID=2005166 RepID=UPI002AB87D58|nr:hypothetical protein [Tabrizicola sp.]MDZ4086165.1 hypothetical protein [Tabrizicola sp.]
MVSSSIAESLSRQSDRLAAIEAELTAQLCQKCGGIRQETGFCGPNVLEAKDFRHRDDCFPRQVYLWQRSSFAAERETANP